MILGKLLKRCLNQPKLVPDAHLAALCLGHGLKICTADSDFERFSEIERINPLA
ncbi:MAG: PIN domain-containing protein [Deltaproteobacteria bacterium]|nr:PIN domain-containing protein [Deltaproteobacteria bacterium]